MGIFNFLKKKKKEEKESEDLEQVLSEIREEYGYESVVEEIPEEIPMEEQNYQEYQEIYEDNVADIYSERKFDRIYEKLSHLKTRKYENDLDIVCLKALCKTEENEENISAIIEIIERLIEKYPDNEIILNLLSQEEQNEIREISLEELIEKLEIKYSNTEIATIKALANINENDREVAIRKYLKKLLDKNKNDEDIITYLSFIKERNKNMTFVKGGKYLEKIYENVKKDKDTCEELLKEFGREKLEKEGFENIIIKFWEEIMEEKGMEKDIIEKLLEKISSLKILDLHVGKNKITQEEWKKHMKVNPTYKKEGKEFVTEITWVEALEFCNKMSEYYGLEPAYKIREEQLYKIVYSDKTEIDPSEADFSKVEGYRLPTLLETISYSSLIKNSHIGEWCYDVKLDSHGFYNNNENEKRNYYIEKINFYKRGYFYNDNDESRAIVEGIFITSPDDYDHIENRKYLKRNVMIGFRVVRTANPKRR